jgi:hypothetical protein
MTTILKKYLLQASLVACFTLTLALGGTGWLYTSSLKENGRLAETITSLETDLEACQRDIGNAIADKQDLDESFDTIQKEYEELQGEFSDIETELRNKKCRGVKQNETTVDVSVADDIADTLGLLRKASCLSNKDCERP